MDAPVVGSVGLRVMLAAFGALGLEAPRIRSESALDPYDLDDPDLLIPASRLYTMWEVAERLWARPALGLSASAMVPVGAYEVGIVSQSHSTLQLGECGRKGDHLRIDNKHGKLGIVWLYPSYF